MLTRLWRQRRQVIAFILFLIASQLFLSDNHGTLHVGSKSEDGKTTIQVVTATNSSATTKQTPQQMHVGIGSNIGKPAMIVVTNTSINTTLQHTTPKQRPCYIIAENKADYHYEVIESALMQYPLPWDTFNCNKEETIADVALTQYHVATNQKEPWKQYFETHLSGTNRSRANGDGAIIHFGEVQEFTKYPREYDAYIGISCDSFQFQVWLKGYPKLYCVLHGKAPEEIVTKYEDRLCWVNPTHPCYFIPSDLPEFPPLRLSKRESIRLCVKRSPDTSLKLLVDAVEKYRQKDKIAIVIMARAETIPEVFGNISDLVSIGGDVDYYIFEENMSRCHALVPLIHPWERASIKYFPWSGQGKLSGYMSQAIGLKIPLLVHEEIRDLYQKHLTAPAWTYTTQNSNDVQSFQDAFSTMMKELPEYHSKRYSFDKTLVWHGGK